MNVFFISRKSKHIISSEFLITNLLMNNQKTKPFHSRRGVLRYLNINRLKRPFRIYDYIVLVLTYLGRAG